MSTAWMLYWWTRLDSIGCFLGVIIAMAIAIGVISTICAIVNANQDYESEKRTFAVAKKTAERSICLAVILLFISIWIPSQKDMAIIVGGQVATNIVQSPEAKELGNKALELINNELDGRLKKKP